jgi:hypothetical protein
MQKAASWTDCNKEDDFVNLRVVKTLQKNFVRFGKHNRYLISKKEILGVIAFYKPKYKINLRYIPEKPW